jgi:hypothetical protein
LLNNRRLTDVHTTSFRRTRQTARPSAAGAGVIENVYADIDALAASLRTLSHGEQVLVVSHSTQVEAIVEKLGATRPSPIGEEFDNVFVVGLTDGAPTLAHLKYEPDPTAESSPVVPTPAAVVVAPQPFPANRPPFRVDALAGRPLAEIAGAADAAANRFAQSNLPTVYLEQNWTAAEALEFYSLRQGSPLMHKDVFNALEQPRGTGLFRDPAFLATYGFLPQRPLRGRHFVGAQLCGLPHVAHHFRRKGISDRWQPGDDRRRVLVARSGLGDATDAGRRAFGGSP